MNVTIKRKIADKTTTEEIVQLILNDRSIDTIEEFLHPEDPVKISLVDFFEDKKKFSADWKRTIKLLEKNHQTKDAIIVYMDYDADGITGGAILWQTLHTLGFNVMPHIPDRKTEGYGFSKVGIDKVIEKYHPKLLISVDHGIVAHEDITYAKSLGVDVIVTDHHTKKETDPEDAYALFHTSEVSGSGVAYYFAKELMEAFAGSNKTDNEHSKLAAKFSSDFLALAAIGTVADLVPLIGKARSLAKYGLDALSSKTLQSPGLSAMLQESGLYGKKIGSYEVGYIIAPRINAFGRISDPMQALRLLCTHDVQKAFEFAKEAGEINVKRQKLVDTAIKEAMNMVQKTEKDLPKIIVLYKEDWEEGIIGLIAGKIMQKFNRPTVAMTNSGENIKASVRSIELIDITAFLREIEKKSDVFVELGGHAAAAGFTLIKSKLKEFEKRVQEIADKNFSDDQFDKVITVDMELNLENLTFELAQALEKLEPFGIGNRKPVFKIVGTLTDKDFLGRDKKHLKLLLAPLQSKKMHVKERDAYGLRIVEQPQKKEQKELLLFNASQEHLDLKNNEDITAVVTIGINVWNSRESLQIIVNEML